MAKVVLDPGMELWSDIYSALAIRLQTLSNQYGRKAGKVLYNRLNSATYYVQHNKWMDAPNIIRSASIDPIQLFTSLNRSRQPDAIRQKIVKIVWEIITKKNPYWEYIDFSGCPAPVPFKILEARPDEEQQEIWELLSSIIKHGKASLTPDAWNNATSWRGIRVASFTIFLFWIDSKNFLPLDSNTHQYLINLGYLTLKSELNLSTYSKLLSYKRIKSYTSLALESYLFLHDKENYRQETPSNSTKDKTLSTSFNFKMVGLRTLAANTSYHKVLHPYTYYSLSQDIQPVDYIEGRNTSIRQFRITANSADSLYDIKDGVKISISAIVGKNGSGKSTLLELILMGIYNYSIQLGYLSGQPPLERLNFEMYWFCDTLYKIEFSSMVTIYRFSEKQDSDRIYHLEEQPISFADSIATFFYSILINYSHFGLNSLDHKLDWITPLSHKNDGYRIPLVINPKRDHGNIDINNERQLLNTRLLQNLLELHDKDNILQSFRHIDNNKFIRYFSIQYNKVKTDNIKRSAHDYIYDSTVVSAIITKQVLTVFDFQINIERNSSYVEEIIQYIVYKTYAISEKYDFFINKYKQAFQNLTKYIIADSGVVEEHTAVILLEKNLHDFYNDIKDEASHIALKLKQAINYLRFPELREEVNQAIQFKYIVDLDKYLNLVNKIIFDNPTESLTVAELLPPAIFMLDFHLDNADKSSFSKASSGEYQMVSVLSSILYHLRNIDSIESMYSYRFVCILLDEIELYFHPNMQRLFVKMLLEAISKLNCSLWGIHILFSTHSPFILSDLLQQNVLRINNGSAVLGKNHYNTFAANIHDLLADEFFLNDGYLGAFSKQQIGISINLLNYIRSKNEKLKEQTKVYEDELSRLGFWAKNDIDKFNAVDHQSYLKDIISIVGEPVIRQNIEQMYNMAFPPSETDIVQNIKDEIKRILKEKNIDPQELL